MGPLKPEGPTAAGCPCPHPALPPAPAPCLPPLQSAIEQLQEELAGARQEVDSWRKVGRSAGSQRPSITASPALPCVCWSALSRPPFCRLPPLPHFLVPCPQAAERQGGQLADAQRQAQVLEQELEAKSHESSALLADTLTLKARPRPPCTAGPL